MSGALGLANKKLYHAAILTRLLAAERQREQVPVSVLLEAVAEPARRHLEQAYGWLLVALADRADLPPEPPRTVTELIDAFRLEEPLRGELVELRQLEAGGWLGELVSGGTAPTRSTGRAGGELALAEQAWDEAQLREWHHRLEALIDRFSHGLEEW